MLSTFYALSRLINWLSKSWKPDKGTLKSIICRRKVSIFQVHLYLVNFFLKSH